MYIVERRAAAGGAACRWQVFTPVSRLSGVCWVERDRPHRIGLPGRERRVARGEPHTEIACRGRGGSSRWPVVGATIDAAPLSCLCILSAAIPACCMMIDCVLHPHPPLLPSILLSSDLHPTILCPTILYPSTLYPLPIHPLPSTKHSHSTLPP